MVTQRDAMQILNLEGIFKIFAQCFKDLTERRGENTTY